jgi:NAD dependent epimerase/dehydratase family enzyme
MGFVDPPSDWLTIVRACLGLEDGISIPSGVLVAATDHPVRNADLMAALRRHLHRPPAPPTTAALLRIGAVVLRSDPALGLTGRYATSKVLRDRGFAYQFATLDAALAELLG